MWPLTWSKLLRDFHGQKVQVVFSDDSEFYWTGTAKVSALVDNGATAGVTITVTAQPFKRTFQTVTALSAEAVSGDKTFTLNVPYLRAYPTFDTSASGFTITYNGETWSLPQGKSTAYGLTLLAGENEIKVHGSGTITVAYEGGAL